MSTVTAAAHDELDATARAALAAIASPRRDDPVLLSIFDAMAGSRLLDFEARRMRERGEGFYTIASAGHESNAFLADALRPSDPALLHYRSGAFFLARSLQAGRKLEDGLRDVLFSLSAATADAASGGRHKVFGHPDLAIIPQTSTIASHLPRAVGVAFAIDRARRLGLSTRWPRDAVAVCSFGDASLNHSTAVGALNTAGYCAHSGIGMPVLFVCEDNGLGISVPTPQGWVAEAARRPGLVYLAADGDDPQATAQAAREAVERVRKTRRPALLHLRTVRFLAHAGTDVESGYRTPASLAADLERDPLIALARWLGDGPDLAQRYSDIAWRIGEIAAEVGSVARITDAATVLAPLAWPADVRSEAARVADPEVRREAFAGRLPEDAGPLTMAQAINATLTDALAARPEAFVFGEDVGRKGGVYGVTRGLAQRFRSTRVFDTLLDEQSILGLGLGLGVSGLLPVPEIQYLAYLHNAEDQLRGEAASLRFFSDDAYRNPMVVRVAGLAYQKGFGGHFHNDNSLAALRDIPGLVVAVPSRAGEAAAMLRTCLAAAVVNGTVSVFVEPIALYHERDVYAPGDRGWLAPYPGFTEHMPIGRAGVYGNGDDVTLVTFGNGVRMSIRVAARLADDGIRARVVDLRWINPLPVGDILREASATGRVVVADETRHAAGVGEGVVTALVENGYTGRIARVASRDSYVPLGDAATLVLLGEEDIERAARRIVG
jgi:2-oxoisovalerate dehydrogenase E1 component